MNILKGLILQSMISDPSIVSVKEGGDSGWQLCS